MPLYSYKAKDPKGAIIEDVVQATSRTEAASIITSQNFQVLNIKNLDKKFNATIGGRIKVADKASFCRFMGTMLRAGLPLTEAVDNIREETKNDRLRKILFDVSFQIRKGSSLSSVLSKYKSDFDTFFLTMIKAGEKSGTVDKSFDYLSKQLMASYELNQKIKGSMMYPIIIVGAMLVNAVVMVTFVLPKLSDVFLQLDVELPTATRLLLQFGTFVGENTVLAIGGFALIFALLIAVFLIESTRNMMFRISMKLPAIKKLINDIDVSRFSRTISTLLQSGVPITAALEVATGVLKNPVLHAKAAEFSQGVSEGKQLSEMLGQGKRVFPVVMTQTIRAGEKSGNLGDVLGEMSDFYEKEVDFSLKRLTAMLEPLLMLIIGVAVGGMVVMMITPIYSLVGGFE